MKILITGANGHLGQRLIAELSPGHDVVAVVRSERAAQALSGQPCITRIVSYDDEEGLTSIANGCDACVHLVGIIKESEGNQFADAHERPCAALASAAAAAGIRHIISLSIVGASTDSKNGCLQSRALSDEILQNGSVPVTILRVPMVLGENDYASRALMGRAASSLALTFRASSLEQPIYAGDVVAAIVVLLEGVTAQGVIELGGPESLSRSQLTKRAGKVLGKQPTLISLPLVLGLGIAWCLERVSNSPPVSCDMLDLLDHDDQVDNTEALARLGIQLTSLDDMLVMVSGQKD